MDGLTGDKTESFSAGCDRQHTDSEPGQSPLDSLACVRVLVHDEDPRRVSRAERPLSSCPDWWRRSQRQIRAGVKPSAVHIYNRLHRNSARQQMSKMLAEISARDANITTPRRG